MYNERTQSTLHKIAMLFWLSLSLLSLAVEAQVRMPSINEGMRRIPLIDQSRRGGLNDKEMQERLALEARRLAERRRDAESKRQEVLELDLREEQLTSAMQSYVKSDANALEELETQSKQGNAFAQLILAYVTGRDGGEVSGSEMNAETLLPLLDKLVERKNEYAIYWKAMLLLSSSVSAERSKGYSMMALLAESRGYAAHSIAAMYTLGYHLEKDDTKALTWFRKAADAGYGPAMTTIGFAYLQGNLGLPKDAAQAHVWLHRAASSEQGLAMSALGELYAHGVGVPVDPAQAIAWFRKGADTGNSDAMNYLGSYYVNGIGVPKDYAIAIAWYRRAAEAGNAYAMRNLGIIYRDGLGVSANDADAIAWFRKASELGDADALAYLGRIYLYGGAGIQKDYSKGLEMSQKSADMGSLIGMLSMGDIYSESLGVKGDDVLAVSWYRKAADAGNPTALGNLAWMYRKGRGVKKDYAKALSLFISAAEAGNTNAAINIAFMYQEGHGVKRDIREAAAWLQKASDKGDPEAMYRLARIALSHGRQIDMDESDAVELLEDAVDRNYAPAETLLEKVYLNAVRHGR